MFIVRGILFLAGLGFLIAGMAFLWGAITPWYTSFLIGSLLTAFAIATLWIAITQTYKALVGGALGTLVAFGAAGIYLLKQGYSYGELCIWIALLSLWYFFLGLKVSHKKAERLPFSIQALFAILLTLSLVQGIYLVILVSSHFVWILRPEYSVVLGWAFIGVSIFFGWALLSPTWEVGYPLLYAILAFDLLLIGPILSLFRESAPIAVIPLFLWSSLIVVLGSAIWILIELNRRFFVGKKRAS